LLPLRPVRHAAEGETQTAELNVEQILRQRRDMITIVLLRWSRPRCKCCLDVIVVAPRSC